MEMILPLHLKFFVRLTHVTPEAIFKETLREVIVLPTLKTLKRIIILFSWKNRSVPTTLGKLKRSRGLASDKLLAFPRPLPSTP